MNSTKNVTYISKRSANSITIEYHDEGTGHVIGILPSLARSGRDYDVVASLLVNAGFRVIRPEPRGIGGSHGPMTELDLHDFILLNCEKWFLIVDSC